MKTWKVISWAIDEKDADGSVPLTCPSCGEEALAPTHGDPGSPIIGVVGMDLIFDNPGNVPPKTFLPAAIRCRNCRTEYADE